MWSLLWSPGAGRVDTKERGRMGWLDDTRAKWRARGLGSIRWHEANANLMKKHKVKLIVES
jgi:hypothetical protein